MSVYIVERDRARFAPLKSAQHVEQQQGLVGSPPVALLPYLEVPEEIEYFFSFHRMLLRGYDKCPWPFGPVHLFRISDEIIRCLYE